MHSQEHIGSVSELVKITLFCLLVAIVLIFMFQPPHKPPPAQTSPPLQYACSCQTTPPLPCPSPHPSSLYLSEKRYSSIAIYSKAEIKTDLTQPDVELIRECFESLCP